jgi:hypothetical protein
MSVRTAHSAGFTDYSATHKISMNIHPCPALMHHLLLFTIISLEALTLCGGKFPTCHFKRASWKLAATSS